jgi:phenylacetate-CoA ligase
MREERTTVTTTPIEARVAFLKLLPRFRRAYDEMEPLAFRERWPRADIEAFQLERLNSVWAHASRHVPWYRELAARTGAPERFDSLEAFRDVVPVLSKSEVGERPEAFLSELAEPGEWHRTGGSTGAPMRNYWSTAAHREILRTRYRHLDLWGFDIFSRTLYLWGHSASLAPGLAGWVERVRAPIEDRLRNRLRLSAYEVGQAALRDYLRRIAEFRPTVVYGYSSALYLLAQEAERTGFRCDSPRLFILTGEPALPVHVDTIERVFDVRTSVEYGAIETGVMASEWPDRTLRVREDVVLIETLPREDGRYEIVPTVLVNPSFPLLRYAIGDVTDAPLDLPRRGFAVLKNVSGRASELSVEALPAFIAAQGKEAPHASA